MSDTVIPFYQWNTPGVFLPAREDCPINTSRDFYSEKSLVLHTHDFLEIAIIADGSGYYATPTEEFPIQRGDVFLIPQGCVHRYYPPKSMLVYNILLRNTEVLQSFPELLTEPALRCFLDLEPRFRKHHNFQYHLRLSEDDLQILVDYWQLMTKENYNRGPHYLTIMWSLLRCFLAQLCRFYSDLNKDTENELMRMAETLKYIDTHFGEPIFCTELAKRYGKSPKFFTLDFRRATGKTPREYLLHFRLEKAREMLRETTLTAKEISARCGFCEPCYFTQRFTKQYKMSPTAFRKTITNA